MSDAPLLLVSESEDGPTMPILAWHALTLARVQASIAAQLDAEGLPSDHPLRAQAFRLAAEVADRVIQKDLEQIKLAHEREQWRKRGKT
jgi:hypothetical protein